ncbi:type II secretion system F family protein, partial [Candidatus Micrarchaeota archaeon]|nr:type II secretion system F family protein [Candidatus Micrarchaeota archaeon]
MANENLFETAGRLFFSRERIKTMEKDLNSAGVNMAADSFAGYVSINVVVITIVLTLFLLLYQPTADMITNGVKQFVDFPFPLIGLLVLILSFFGVYFGTMALITSYMLMKADDRRSKLEAVLPDFLTLVASNIKAGMTLDQAMWYSAKPEFGLLSTEVKTRIKSSFSGQSLGSTLDQLGARFDSRVFKRTILLLKQASATGGELTSVLERTAEDVRNNIIMKKEIAASLVLYEIFVLFASVIGAPFLFAVASKLIEVFERLGPQAGSVSASAGGVFSTFSAFKFAGPAISSSDFFWFSVPMIFVTALISSFIVSVIRTGSKDQGMKYFPFILVLSYLVYWMVVNAVES